MLRTVTGMLWRQGYLRRIAIALTGDLAIFLLFAAIGRSSHGEAHGVTHVVGTALPFIAAWLLAAPWFGVLGPAAFGDVQTALVRAGRTWIVGVIIALAIRSALEGRIVPWTFALIAFLFNLVLLAGWHSLLAALWRRRSRFSVPFR